MIKFKIFSGNFVDSEIWQINSLMNGRNRIRIHRYWDGSMR